MHSPRPTNNNKDYLHPGVSKVLKNVTKYVSKPLGLNKPYTESKMKHGKIFKDY